MHRWMDEQLMYGHMLEDQNTGDFFKGSEPKMNKDCQNYRQACMLLFN